MLRSLAFALLAVPVLASAQAKSFVLTSPDVKPGAKIPIAHAYNGRGGSGENISPALEWQGSPAATKGYALTMYDPDAPTGSGWWHWVVYNIPVSVTSLPA